MIFSYLRLLIQDQNWQKWKLSIQALKCPPLDSLLKPCQTKLLQFNPTSSEEISSIIMKSSKASCSLDPIPTSLLRDLLPTLAPITADLVNSSLSSGKFPSNLKSAIVQPLLKETCLDTEILRETVGLFPTFHSSPKWLKRWLQLVWLTTWQRIV